MLSKNVLKVEQDCARLREENVALRRMLGAEPLKRNTATVVGIISGVMVKMETFILHFTKGTILVKCQSESRRAKGI